MSASTGQILAATWTPIRPVTVHADDLTEWNVNLCILEGPFDHYAGRQRRLPDTALRTYGADSLSALRTLVPSAVWQACCQRVDALRRLHPEGAHMVLSDTLPCWGCGARKSDDGFEHSDTCHYMREEDAR
jgi:hypothetical protein